MQKDKEKINTDNSTEAKKPPKTKKREFNEAMVMDAIMGSGGIMSTIAKRLDCDWSTARAYCFRWENTERAYKTEYERTLDMSESVILKAISENDIDTAKWYLNRKGRVRGYGDKLELDGNIGHDITVMSYEERMARKKEVAEKRKRLGLDG